MIMRREDEKKRRLAASAGAGMLASFLDAGVERLWMGERPASRPGSRNGARAAGASACHATGSTAPQPATGLAFREILQY